MIGNKILAAALGVFMLFSLVGCGQKVAEQVVKKTTGGAVEVKGDKVTIKGQSGETVTVGGTHWPKNTLGKSVPVFKGGKIESVMESEAYVLIMLKEVSQNDFGAYVELLKKEYTEDSFSTAASDRISYCGANEKGVTAQASYEVKEKVVTIALAKKS